MKKYLYSKTLSSKERAFLQKKFDVISNKKFINENFYYAEEDYSVAGRRYFSIDGNGEFVSVNSFFGQRRKENLSKLNSFYLDLDIQKDIDKNFTSFDTKIVKVYANKVIDRCKSLNIPTPTRIVSSGNGLHLYWDLGTEDDEIYGPARKVERKFKSVGVSKNMVRLYLAIQKELINNFKDLGADSACKDVSRVLRIPGTMTKDGDITKNIMKRHEFDYQALCVISDFSNLLNYSYSDYKEWLQATDKQKNFAMDLINEGNLSKEYISKLDSETRFSIAELIKKGVMRRPATQKQIEAIKKNNTRKLNYIELRNLTMEEADSIIKSTINRNTNYIDKYLRFVFNKGLVVEGRRSMFTYYYAIGQKLLHPNMETEQLLDKVFKSWSLFNLDIPKTEAEVYIRSGIEHNGTGIRKKTLIDFFEGDIKVKEYKKKKVIKTNKDKIEDAIKKDIVENTQKSLREIARELNVSHTYVKKVKDNFRKKTQKKLLAIKESKLVSSNLHDSIREIVSMSLGLSNILSNQLTNAKAFELYIDLSMFQT